MIADEVPSFFTILIFDELFICLGDGIAVCDGLGQDCGLLFRGLNESTTEDIDSPGEFSFNRSKLAIDIAVVDVDSTVISGLNHFSGFTDMATIDIKCTISGFNVAAAGSVNIDNIKRTLIDTAKLADGAIAKYNIYRVAVVDREAAGQIEVVDFNVHAGFTAVDE